MSRSAPQQPRTTRLRSLGRWARRLGRSWMEQARGGEYLFLLFTAAIIGILGGVGSIIFGAGIHLVQNISWGLIEPTVELLRTTSPWKLLLIPAAGGLIVGLITTFFASEAKGHGVPQVIKAVALAGARIRGRVALAKIFASAITIGSGGSAGREGPVIQIGAAIGSRIGQAMGMSTRRLRTLVACGAAAGIAGTFNAPVAGALFSVEVILGEFGAAQFSPIVISSVLATVVARSWHGNAAVFSPPPCTFASPWELIPYLLLGALCGLASWVYIHLISRAEILFDRPGRLPNWSRPALGGLMLGALALFFPQVMGGGLHLCNQAFSDHLPALLLLTLAVAKLLATGFTLGSGGSGGVFSPALALGALLGAFVGTLAEPLLGARFGGVAAYSLVGMGGVIAGTMLAPITAILMVIEITSNYAIILPVMTVVILSTVLSSRLSGHLSIYTFKLARDGIRLFRGRSPDLLQAHRVADHLQPHFETTRPSESARDLVDRILSSPHAQFYVVDDEGALLGTITLADARRILLSPPALLGVLMAEDVMRRHTPYVLPGSSLSDALAKFASTHLPELPVLHSLSDRRLLGTLAYPDVLNAYQDEIFKADAPQALSRGLASLSAQPLEIAPGYELSEWEPPADLHGKSLADARLPDTRGARVLLIKRIAPDGTLHTFLPDARTIIQAADTLILLGPPTETAESH
ncbi:MAG: chloride channel protein [Kiritimatiellae bacterium]|nr:chloride channel protein [Kiritimatiellia bacterium]MDD4341165.1 chloride channel protein [Kiritimatiellia bacterium]